MVHYTFPHRAYKHNGIYIHICSGRSVALGLSSTLFFFLKATGVDGVEQFARVTWSANLNRNHDKLALLKIVKK